LGGGQGNGLFKRIFLYYYDIGRLMKFYLVLLAFIIIIGLSVPGSAYTSYGDEIPGVLNGQCIVCHEETTGGPINSYGIDYGKSDSIDDIEFMDSDSDGFSNKEELEKGFLPGDPTDFPRPEGKSNSIPGFGIIGLTVGIIGALLLIKGRGR
jgi:hypothetical protein